MYFTLGQTETFSVGNFTCTCQSLKVSQTYLRSEKPGYIRGDLGGGGGGALIQDLAGGEGSNFQCKPSHLSWPMLRHLRFTRVFLSRLSAVDE